MTAVHRREGMKTGRDADEIDPCLRQLLLVGLLSAAGCLNAGFMAGAAMGSADEHPIIAGSGSLPPWTRLNGPALRTTGPRSIEIVIDKPPHFQSDHDMLGARSYPFEVTLKDPAPRLGRSLGGAISKRLGLAVSGIRPSEDKSSLPSDLSLTVGTFDWSVDCTAEGGSTCAVMYRGTVRLVDNRPNKLVAAGICQVTLATQLLDHSIDPDAKVNAPRVQEALNQAVDDCADQLRHDPLGIYGSSP